MIGINTLTVLYLTGLAALGQALIYFLLLGRSPAHEQRAWLGYQVLMGLGLIGLAAGITGEPLDFYVIAVLLILGGYWARSLALAMVLGAPWTKRAPALGLGVIIFVGILFTWCHSLGAPLGSLETILLLPLGVASGLTAKYVWDQPVAMRSVPMRLMVYILCLECGVYGMLAMGALAGLGQDYVQPQAMIFAWVVLLNFVIQLVMPMLWMIYCALEKQVIFAGLLGGVSRSAPIATKSRVSSKPVSESTVATAITTDVVKPVSRVTASAESHLTAKELEVLRLVVLGQKNKQIAEALQISEASVKVHKSRMTSKLGVKTLPELAAALAHLGEVSSAIPLEAPTLKVESKIGHEE